MAVFTDRLSMLVVEKRKLSHRRQLLIDILTAKRKIIAKLKSKRPKVTDDECELATLTSKEIYDYVYR